MRKESLSRKAFNIFNIAFMIFVVVVTLFPYLNILARAFNEGADTAKGGITLLPRVFTLENFGTVIFDKAFLVCRFRGNPRFFGFAFCLSNKKRFGEPEGGVCRCNGSFPACRRRLYFLADFYSAVFKINVLPCLLQGFHGGRCNK